MFLRLIDCFITELNPKLAEPVLHNDRIKIGNKVISYTQWIEKGVYNLANFVGNTGKLLTFTEFRNKYGIYMDFVTYSGLILSLKKYLDATFLLLLL